MELFRMRVFSVMEEEEYPSRKASVKTGREMFPSLPTDERNNLHVLRGLLYFPSMEVPPMLKLSDIV